MNKQPLIHVGIVGNYPNYADWITFPHDITIISSGFTDDVFEKLDLIIFAGGSDVSPVLYQESKHTTTSSDPERDVFESSVYKYARLYKIPIIGICRGAQFVTVMSGGKLFQHVENHGIQGTHPLYLEESTEIISEITSTHHQMMCLDENVRHVPLLMSSRRSSFYCVNDKITYTNLLTDQEPEVIYYPTSEALAIQGHPEYMPKNSSIIGLLNFYLSILFNLTFDFTTISSVPKHLFVKYKLCIKNSVFPKILKDAQPRDTQSKISYKTIKVDTASTAGDPIF